MARIRGTGDAPSGQYPGGQIADSPDDSAEYNALVDAGWVDEVDPKDDPARSLVQIANAIVRGDALTDPVDQEIAAEFQGFGDNPEDGLNPWDVVHQQSDDPAPTDSEAGESGGGPGDAGNNVEPADSGNASGGDAGSGDAGADSGSSDVGAGGGSSEPVTAKKPVSAAAKPKTDGPKGR